MYRIRVSEETAPYSWSELKEQGSIPAHKATGLAQSCKRRGGNPSRWRGSFERVYAKDWLAVETFNGSQWEPLPPNK